MLGQTPKHIGLKCHTYVTSKGEQQSRRRATRYYRRINMYCKDYYNLYTALNYVPKNQRK